MVSLRCTRARAASLSKQRAKAVIDFLVAEGISAGRFEYRGLGESSPKIPVNGLKGDELDATARNMAATLAKKPPRALQASKRLMRESINKPLHQVVKEDLALFGEMLQGDEAKAVIAAMVSKSKG